MLADYSQSKILHSRIFFIASIIIFKCALDISYTSYLTVAFNDHFLTPFNLKFSALQYIESFIWVILIALFTPFSSKSAGGLAFFCAFVFLLIPVATIYGLDDDRSRATLALATLAILAANVFSSVAIGPSVHIKLPKDGHKPLLFISFIFCGLFLIISAVSGVIFSMNFNIGDVYNFRSEVQQKIDIGIFVYSNLWAQKVFTPLILALGLYKRSILMILFALFMHVIYFGVTQHRAHLFSPLLVFFTFWLYRREFSYALGFFAFSFLLIAINLLILFFDLEDLGSLLIRRALFVGPSVTYSWIEYFSINPKVYFSDNLLSSLVNNQYTNVNLPNFMGDYMRQGYEIGFNSGMVGSGFAQLGVFGVVIYGAIFGLFVRLNERLLEAGAPPYIAAAILFFPYRIAWADSDVFTALLSHGIIVGTFSVWLFGAANSNTKKFPALHDRQSMYPKPLYRK